MPMDTNAPATVNPPTVTPPQTETSLLPQTAKAAAFVTACFYITGLLTVNTYLYQLGVSDFSVLRPRFIYIGWWVFTFITVSFIPVVFLLALWLPMTQSLVLNRKPFNRLAQSRHRRMFLFASFVITTVLYYGAIQWILRYARRINVPQRRNIITLLVGHPYLEAILLIILIYIISTSFILLIVQLMPLRNNVTQIVQASSAEILIVQLVKIFVILCFLITSLYLYISYFAQNFYPAIPEVYGGGRYREAQILFKSDSVTGIKQLNIPFSSLNGGIQSSPTVTTTAIITDTLLSERLVLLFEGTDIYVIRLESGEIVQIKKDTVAAIKYMLQPRP